MERDHISDECDYSVSEKLSTESNQSRHAHDGTSVSYDETIVEGNGRSEVMCVEDVCCSQLPSGSIDLLYARDSSKGDIHHTKDNPPAGSVSGSKNASMMQFCTMKLNLLAATTSPCNSTTETVTSPEPAAYSFKENCVKRLKNPKSSHNVHVDSSTHSLCKSSRHVTAQYSTRQVEQIKLDALYHRITTQIKVALLIICTEVCGWIYYHNHYYLVGYRQRANRQQTQDL